MPRNDEATRTLFRPIQECLWLTYMTIVLP